MPKEFSVGSHIADHMLEINWSSKNGWTKPKIVPVHNFHFSPFNKSLQFSLAATDGFVAYKSTAGKIMLFRPFLYAKRLCKTNDELRFPEFEHLELVRCLEELVKADKDWVPDYPGGLLIRPLLFTNECGLCPYPPQGLTLIATSTPFKPPYNGPIKLMLEMKHAKNVPGGSAGAYLPANYGITLKTLQYAKSKGYQEVLWMDSSRHITETCTSNFFMVWTNKLNVTELVTAPLKNAVLPGIIRDTIIMLAGEYKKIKFRSEEILIDDLVLAGKEKRVK